MSGVTLSLNIIGLKTERYGTPESIGNVTISCVSARDDDSQYQVMSGVLGLHHKNVSKLNIACSIM